MPSKPYAYMRVVMSGKMGTVQDWSTGLSFFVDATVTVPATTAWLAAISTAVTNWYNAGSPSCAAEISADTTLEKITAYYYPAGATAASQVAEYVYSSPLNGSGSAALSDRDAMVVSLLTGTPGRSGRGRMYIPANGPALTNHQYTNTHITDVVTATHDLIVAINASTYNSVALATTAIVAGKTTGHLINQVRCDSLPDTQRRREDKLGALHVLALAVP